MIAKQVNELSLQQIIFLDFLLKDFEFCPLSEALKIALPIVFETHVETQAELKNISQLCKLLHFACRRHLSQQTVAFLIKSVLDEATRLDLKSAKIVVHSICELDTIDDNSVLLLHQALDVIVNNKSKCSYSDFDVILSKLASKFSQKRFYLYHENFLHSATSFIVERQRSFEEGVWIVKKASKFGFVNLKLLGYLAAKAERVPHVLSDCGTLILFSFVGGLSLADYRPNNWNILEPLILKNAFSHIGAVELPWMKFALDLCTLDCWPLKLLDSLFNCDFLSKYLSRGCKLNHD
ncbi:hypothetical protein AAG570_012834 [Ranatra chinensis]|uniref:FAST kinase leucine-rich domain-containing protein n=1 Tax=Ranatra chinensis TaxID=642074 RepID=A0ABD0YF05_9HEMI